MPHIHFENGKAPSGHEARGLVHGSSIRPDGFVAARNEVWLFHGNYYHGFPPEHKWQSRVVRSGISAAEAYKLTLKQMEQYVEGGYIVRYVWEHEYREFLANQKRFGKENCASLSSIVHTLRR